MHHVLFLQYDQVPSRLKEALTLYVLKVWFAHPTR
jgi:hypothetical protein